MSINHVCPKGPSLRFCLSSYQYSIRFGVGELSAINGIAGCECVLMCVVSALSVGAAFAERVPVVHIVGTPSTKQMKAKPLLHHTLGNGHFEAYSKAVEHFVVASAILSEPSTAAAEIDRVLIDCVTKVVQCYNSSHSIYSYLSRPVSPRLHNTSDGPGWRHGFRNAARNAS